MRLSIAIPIYNFANFIVETLDSIVTQDGAGEVEIVVVDGASTDATPQLMEAYRARHPQVGYVRLPQKGGIDRDMATAFASTHGDYCWLFSGDDIMRPGALRRALQEIESGADVILSKHMEFIGDRNDWQEWPVLAPGAAGEFELSDREQRIRYFASAVNTEAFFSFMGGMINRRASWDRVPFNAAFEGSCWAHAARQFELMKMGLRLRYVPECWQDRRPDNDSFMGRGFVHRIAISIEGYHRIADTFFGRKSVEAFHVRRVIRYEFGIGMLVMGKYMCMINPEVEDLRRMNRMALLAYSDLSLANLAVLRKYFLTPASRFRKWQPQIAAKQDALVRMHRVERDRR